MLHHLCPSLILLPCPWVHVFFNMLSHMGVFLSSTSCSWAVACTSAQVGPILSSREGQCNQSPCSFLSHSSPESSLKVSGSDSAPTGIPFTRDRDSSCTDSVPSYGNGNMLLRSFANLNSIMGREANTPLTGTH